MIHGKGDQYWITETYENKRRLALEDRLKYDDIILDSLDVLEDKSLGGGRTDPDTYTISQFPFPINTSIKDREKVDIRKVDKRIGGV